MTLLREVRKGKIPEIVERIAEEEGVELNKFIKLMSEGRIVIPRNKYRKNLTKPVGIGESLRVKVNTNIGTSPDQISLEYELKKLEVSIQAGTDTVMDLSTGGDIDFIRDQIIANSPVPVGTVPIYQAVCELSNQGGKLEDLTADFLFDVIERQARDGVDFMTVHCGVTRNNVELLNKQGRILGIVSRGGSFIAQWMKKTNKENPLYENFDRLIEIAEAYDITLSLGDGLRPGCLADATDRAQIGELVTLGELTKRAWIADVQVMIEGPGHVPIDQIIANIQLEKKLCQGAPFYVLGPLVTDIAPGYDHIGCAIGGAIAGLAGADFLCYVTPSEHLRLPTIEDVREGVIATRIAAHAVDIGRKNPKAWKWDIEMAKARANLDWDKQLELAIYPEKAKQIRNESLPSESEVCTMCGKFCAIRGFMGE